MRILVCVKQVPEPGTVNMNPETGSIVREGKAVINPFDLYAMEAAARLKDQDETVQISALCMGPAEAASVLKDCMALGADKAWLVSGEEFDEFRNTVKAAIARLCSDMLSGDISIAPKPLYGGRDRTSCTFCGYRSICLFEN